MSDEIDQTAFNFAAPADERKDAGTQLTKAHMPLKSALIPSEEIQPVIDHILNNMADQEIMRKANGGRVVIPFPNKKKRVSGGPQSVVLDDLQVFASGDYFEKPSQLGFDSMRMMVDQTPILSAVVMTRVRQISAFCKPASSDSAPGFEICHADREHKIQPDEVDSIKNLTSFINNCGWEFRPRHRQRLHRSNLTGFMSKLVRDSLSMDAAAIETEYKKDKRKGIDGFYAVDGATIRLCTDQGYEGDDEIFAVQLIQGQIRTAYTYDELIYVPRNPRTDVTLAGYGLSETELLIKVVTGFLNAMTYNIKGFDDNSIPPGMLHLSGSYDANDITVFKRYWNAMVKGVSNAWTMPVMISEDQESKASFEKFGVEFNEMHFAKWMTFLTSIVCAIYGMSPDEINFESFSAQQSSLSGTDTGEKLASSKDKGLHPLMSYLESLISDYIISDYSEKYVFRWTGLDDHDKEKSFEMRKLTTTVDEARAEEGLEPLGDVMGGAPLNPSLLALYQQSIQPEEDYGQPGAEGGEPGADGQHLPGDEQQQGEQEEQDQQAQPGGERDTDGAAPDFGGEDRQGDFGKSFIYTIE